MKVHALLMLPRCQMFSAEKELTRLKLSATAFRKKSRMHSQSKVSRLQAYEAFINAHKLMVSSPMRRLHVRSTAGALAGRLRTGPPGRSTWPSHRDGMDASRRNGKSRLHDRAFIKRQFRYKVFQL
jgi:hypothetical protein